MSKKKGHHEEHENHERWLVSYADFMTLLMAFFVVMYSVSKVDNKKLSQATESIKWAMHMGGEGGKIGQMPLFDGPLSEGGTILGMNGSAGRKSEMERIRQRISRAVEAFIMQRQPNTPAPVTVELEDQHVIVRLTAADFFDPGLAALRPQSLPILDAVAEELAPVDRPIRVEAHTDATTPGPGSRFKDNWELSAARAATVASYLERAHGVPPEHLTAAGFASTRPLDPGDTPEANAINRRVELVLELEVKPSSRARSRAREMPVAP